MVVALSRCWLWRSLQRRSMRHVAIQRAWELHLVIGIDPRIVLPPGHRDVRESLVNKLLARTLGLDMHQDATGGLTLATVARHRVAVIEMAAFARCG